MSSARYRRIKRWAKITLIGVAVLVLAFLGRSLFGGADEPGPAGTVINDATADGEVGTIISGIRLLGSAGDWTPLEQVDRTPARVVLLIHGLDEPGSIWNDLAPRLIEAGYSVARFDYPNDQAIVLSADLLATALVDLKAHGTQRVDMVCHSMGGLVARDVLTRQGYYHGLPLFVSSDDVCSVPGGADESDLWREGAPAVERLITLGTPHAGSPWAKLRTVAELRERVMRYAKSGKLGELTDWTTDGTGQAGDDLMPGSAFLEDLNARPLPRGIAITCVVGAMSPIDDGDLDDAAPMLRRVFGGDEADRLARSVHDLTTTLGDGVVPVDSAALEGVEDVVHVKAYHRTMVKTWAVERNLRDLAGTEAKVAPAIPIVLDRLARPLPSDSD
jgi:pimeloyl-ACP methyl ester carboxylesterase